jgi:hypothetical protein
MLGPLSMDFNEGDVGYAWSPAFHCRWLLSITMMKQAITKQADKFWNEQQPRSSRCMAH